MGACVSKGKKRDSHDASGSGGGDTKKNKTAGGPDSPKQKGGHDKAKEAKAGESSSSSDHGEAAEGDGTELVDLKEKVVDVDLEEVSRKGAAKAKPKLPKTTKKDGQEEPEGKGAKAGRQEEVMKNKDGSTPKNEEESGEHSRKRSPSPVTSGGRGEEKVRHLKEKWEKEESSQDEEEADEQPAQAGAGDQQHPAPKKKKKQKKEEIEREKRRQQEKEELEREKKRQAELERIEREEREKEERERRARLEREEQEKKDKTRLEREEFEKREREEREQAARDKAEHEEKERQELAAKGFKDIKSKWEKKDDEPATAPGVDKKISPRRMGELQVPVSSGDDQTVTPGRQDRFRGLSAEEKKVADAKSQFEKKGEVEALAKDGRGAGGKVGSGWEDKQREEEKAKKLKELLEAGKTDSGVDKKELEKRKAQLRDMKDPYWAKLAQDQQLLTKEEREAARIEAELRKLEADLEDISDVDTSELASSSSDSEAD